MTEDYLYRFGGIGRLYGQAELKKLSQSHAAVIGLGGVGTWAAEALVRTGLGRLTLVDFDEVCLSNVNRQLHAMDGQVGRLKIESLKERFKLINPHCEITLIADWFNQSSEDQVFSGHPHVVVDAVDDLKNKCRLIAGCRQRDVGLVTVGGAAGRRRPNKIQVADLSRTHGDRLLQKVRSVLRKEYRFPNGKEKFKVPCVFSAEEPYFPSQQGCVTQDTQARPSTALDCSTGMGTATFVTGTFGFLAAAEAIDQILK